MSLDDLVRRRPPAVQLPPVDGVVTSVSGAGVFVTPVGQQTDHPIGQCRGPRTNGGAPIAPGMHVLVVFAASGPWIVAVDE